MTEPSWRFLYFDIKRETWLAVDRPSFDEAARLRAWRTTIETSGFPPGTVLWEDENFVARVPGTRVVVTGVAVPYEGLLIIEAIRNMRVVG